MKYLVSTLFLLLGRYRRKQGRYNHHTLRFFYRTYQLNGNVAVLLAYIRFRRDLGYPLTRRLAAQLLANIRKLSQKQRRQAANLLIEAGFTTQLTSAIDLSTLSPLAIQSPPIAALLSQQNEKEPANLSRVLADLHQKQSAWRCEFADYLRRQSNSICIVGNAGSLIGSQHGEQIDGYDVVVRFNHYTTTFSDDKDSGRKMTVWCCAPNCTELFANKDSTLWSVLSGPDMCYQLAEWQHIATFVQRGGKVVTTPLPIWRNLVRLLQAPPSAGLLLIYWIITIRGSIDGLAIAGFDTRISSKPYHQALPKHKATNRHNWQAEKVVLQQWETQGLVVL